MIVWLNWISIWCSRIEVNDFQKGKNDSRICYSIGIVWRTNRCLYWTTSTYTYSKLNSLYLVEWIGINQ